MLRFKSRILIRVNSTNGKRTSSIEFEDVYLSTDSSYNFLEVLLLAPNVVHKLVFFASSIDTSILLIVIALLSNDSLSESICKFL